MLQVWTTTPNTSRWSLRVIELPGNPPKRAILPPRPHPAFHIANSVQSNLCPVLVLASYNVLAFLLMGLMETALSPHPHPLSLAFI